MYSATVCNCPYNTPDPACPQAESSRQSGQQQKTPDVRRYILSWYRGTETSWLLAERKTLAVTEVRNWRAVIDQVPRSLVVLASVRRPKHTELVFDTLRNVQPVKIK